MYCEEYSSSAGEIQPRNFTDLLCSGENQKRGKECVAEDQPCGVHCLSNLTDSRKTTIFFARQRSVQMQRKNTDTALMERRDKGI